jgi:hypothetical protein
MAQKVQVVLTCDLDDNEDVPAVETVSFSFEGSSYAFELCEAHLEEFTKVMRGYVESARLADGGRRRRAGTSGPGRGRSRRPAEANASQDIRTWARANGYTVNERGRIPADVRAAYEAAN